MLRLVASASKRQSRSGSSGTGNSGSGCNMGFGVIALLAGVPLLKKHNR